MADAKVLTNQQFAWLSGPSTAIADANWATGPTNAQIASLTNISEAVKIDGSDLNFEASDQNDDRSFIDAAGAQSRAYSNFSGNIEIYTPGDTPTTIITNTWNALSKTRTKVVVAQRPVKSSTAAIAAGDEINLFLGLTDARSHERNDSSRTLQIALLPQGQMLSNYIVPASTPGSITVAPSGSITATAGTPKFLKVTYQGRNITVGATYVSSDQSKFKVTPHGIILPVAAGTATLTVSYPGAAALTPISVTVS